MTEVQILQRPRSGEFPAEQALLNDVIMTADKLRENGTRVRSGAGREPSMLSVEDKLLTMPVTACSEPHHKIGLPLLGNAAPSPRQFPTAAHEDNGLHSAQRTRSPSRPYRCEERAGILAI